MVAPGKGPALGKRIILLIHDCARSPEHCWRISPNHVEMTNIKPINEIPKWALSVGRDEAFHNISKYFTFPYSSISHIISFYNSLKHSCSHRSQLKSRQVYTIFPSNSPAHLHPRTPTFFFDTGEEVAHLLDKVIPLTDVHPLSRTLFLQLIAFSLESWIFHYMLDYFYQQRNVLNVTSLY